MAFLIGFSIYCGIIKYQAKQKQGINIKNLL